MKTANNRNVTKAIKKEIGLDDVKLFKSGGCVSFYSDNEETSEILSVLKTRTVYVNAINQLTVEQWVEELAVMMGDYWNSLCDKKG